MADFPAQELVALLDVGSLRVTPDDTPMAFEGSGAFGGGGVSLPTFKMRGRDNGRAPGSDYIVWTFTGAEPDFAGTGFAGGLPTPIGSLIAGSVVKLATLTGQ